MTPNSPVTSNFEFLELDSKCLGAVGSRVSRDCTRDIWLFFVFVFVFSFFSSSSNRWMKIGIKEQLLDSCVFCVCVGVAGLATMRKWARRRRCPVPKFPTGKARRRAWIKWWKINVQFITSLKFARPLTFLFCWRTRRYSCKDPSSRTILAITFLNELL